jgi:alcohol dehydrogenase class IV
VKGFDWQDGDRRIHFGRGRAADAVELAGGPGYVLLTTERAAEALPGAVEAAAAVHHVGPGLVEDVAGDLLGPLGGAAAAQGPAGRNGGPGRIVALGGGRVVDVAKAVAAALGELDEPAGVVAFPTTLSGAEMTGSHRVARGARVGVNRVRPSVVVNDPLLSASQPEPDLAASALNAMAHAVEAPCTLGANPVSTLAAREAARLLAGAFPERGAVDRDALALGALLAGWAMDSTGFGLHHVLAQTLVRVAGIPHGTANAVLLSQTIGALAWRFPEQHEALAAALGGDPAEVTARLTERAGVTSLGALGVDHATLEACADAAAERDDLEKTPPRAGRGEILALYEHAH